MLDQFNLSSVPHSPGVYLMLGESSKVIYVGKAKDLVKRLSSYVHYQGPAHSKTAVMLRHVEKVDVLLTRTEKEALILESSLIKRHRPKYNVILRDDKSYPLIKVTVQEEWPRVHMTRRKKRDGARYFGPYSSPSAMWATLKVLSALFPLRRCKGPDLKKRARPCLNYQMGRCQAPCAGRADRNAYMAMVEKVLLFLEGRNTDLLKELHDEMQQASSRQEFEKAAVLRDRIGSLRDTLEKQIIVSHGGKDRDVFGFARQDVSVSIALLSVRGGVIRGNRRFYLGDPYGDDSAILSQILKQVYDEKNAPPAEILLPHPIEDQDILGERLSDIADRKVALAVPKRGDRHALIVMATANARQLFADQDRKSEAWDGLAAAMSKKLQLPDRPEVIECLDISNISGTDGVGSLVRFRSGEPETNGYRRYKIKSVEGPDDYAMMREVLLRRFTTDDEDGALPDLFMVDGGRGHLNIAAAIAGDLRVDRRMNLLAIAKERRDEGEKLYKPGRKNPIVLPAHDPVLLYLMRIRDEAHRFGVTFHRSLRRKKTLGSSLDRIDGVGPARKRNLLAALGSMRNIAAATVEELQAVDGIGPELAAAIHTFFRTGETSGGAP